MKPKLKKKNYLWNLYRMKGTNKLTTKFPRTQFKDLLKLYARSRELNLGTYMLERRSGAGERPMDNKLRNY